jgi:hypothetical protein
VPHYAFLAAQRLRVFVIDADRQGQKGNCRIDLSEQLAKKNFTTLFYAIGDESTASIYLSAARCRNCRFIALTRAR